MKENIVFPQDFTRQQQCLRSCGLLQLCQWDRPRGALMLHPSGFPCRILWVLLPWPLSLTRRRSWCLADEAGWWSGCKIRWVLLAGTLGLSGASPAPSWGHQADSPPASQIRHHLCQEVGLMCCGAQSPCRGAWYSGFKCLGRGLGRMEMIKPSH